MIKSRKEILHESSEELSRIRKNIKIQEKYPKNKWYSEMGIDIFESTIEEYGIKKSEVLRKIVLCKTIDKKNGIYPTVSYITKSPTLYNKLVEMSKPLKEKKFLYSWYMDILKLSVSTVVSRYNMDHLMVLEYLLQNRKQPQKNSARELLITGIASYYYIKNKNKKGASDWLSQLARIFMLGI